jgi:signal transduction histidine kinase
MNANAAVRKLSGDVETGLHKCGGSASVAAGRCSTIGWMASVGAYESAPGTAAPLSPDDEAALEAYLRDILLRSLRIGTWFMIVVTVAWWPLDYLLMERMPEIVRTLTWVRAAGVAVMLAGNLTTFTAWGRRHPVLTSVVVLAGCHGLVGVGFGRVSGLDQPFFHFAMLGLVVPLVAPLALPLRVVGVLSVALPLAAGYFLPYPHHLSDPNLGLTLSFLGFVTLAAVTLGHIVYTLTRRSFLQERALARLGGELASLNGSLERTVAAQTEELRLLAAHLQEAREEERAHLSREIHDELGQELTALHYSLTLTRRRYDKEPAAVGPNLRDLSALLDRVATCAREIVSNLRPRVLDELGLAAAAEWLVETTAARTGIICHMAARAVPKELGEGTRIAAFRILQEALTNVARHAGARRVEVEIEGAGGELRLVVSDDGTGMPKVIPSGRWGLLGMRERVRAQGGQLTIESVEGGGTRVLARLPVRPPYDEPEGSRP